MRFTLVYIFHRVSIIIIEFFKIIILVVGLFIFRRRKSCRSYREGATGDTELQGTEDRELLGDGLQGVPEHNIRDRGFYPAAHPIRPEPGGVRGFADEDPRNQPFSKISGFISNRISRLIKSDFQFYRFRCISNFLV